MVSSFRQELMKSLARRLRSNVYLAANTRVEAGAQRRRAARANRWAVAAS